MKKLSIIIPYKDSDKNIDRTLKSLKFQKVNYNDYEVLLIDDFSNKKTTQILKNILPNLRTLNFINLKRIQMDQDMLEI